ncbi:MAG: hypothetical protein MUP19_05195, partial [Candidatus Aminicenantes bacterium]|nr:hypothetical protein [Candidatus Aminicenantes bacterium]
LIFKSSSERFTPSARSDVLTKTTLDFAAATGGLGEDPPPEASAWTAALGAADSPEDMARTMAPPLEINFRRVMGSELFFDIASLLRGGRLPSTAGPCVWPQFYQAASPEASR